VDLSRIEQEVVHAYRVGSPLALTGDLTHRTIRGEVVARLVTGEIVPAGPRSRLDLAGSVIDGPVDLTGAVIDRPVSMRDCSFTHPAVLTEAEVRTLRLPGCRLPALEGTNLRVQGDLELDAGFSTTGRVVLIGARIAGLLRMSQAHVGTDQSLVEDDLPVLCASRMRVEGAVMAAGLRVHGQLKLVSVRVGGHLSLKDASITHTGHTALHAERWRSGRACWCSGRRSTGASSSTTPRSEAGSTRPTRRSGPTRRAEPACRSGTSGSAATPPSAAPPSPAGSTPPEQRSTAC
jgi:hypothetical protein